MPLRPFIQRALEAENLTAPEAREAMGHVMRGEATAAQIAAWLVAMRIKRETVAELSGFATAMREAMITLPGAPDDAIDTCGTGGDGLGTFNISTAAALITAACGVPVAKHGNRAVSSQSGSADVLSALGFEIDPGIERVSHALKQTGFAFMFAPRFHPAMMHAAVPRREIGVRTVFNMLGPLCNPAMVRRQIIGVFDRSRAREIAEVLAALGTEHALVISGPGGADELLPTGDNLIVEWDGKTISEKILTVQDFGVRHCSVDDLLGGDAQRSASIIRGIAEGAHGPKRETAVLNAAAALYVAGEVASIAEGVELAHAAIHDGRVLDLLQRAAEATRVTG
jgi:anthranilate phosphoribosyltransferase